jgi:hypothetical protein
MSASLGLWWWQHIIVKGLHKHCIQVVIVIACQQNLLALRKTILIPRIKLCPSDPTIFFKLCRTQFPVKVAFVVTIGKAEGQMFNYAGISTITSLTPPPPMASLIWHLPEPFHMTMSLLQLLKGINNT